MEDGKGGEGGRERKRVRSGEGKRSKENRGCERRRMIYGRCRG